MNKQQLLLQERFNEKIKFSEEYLNKYGRDWYQGLTPSPIAIFFPENEDDVTDIIDFASKNKLKIVISGGRTGLNGGASLGFNNILFQKVVSGVISFFTVFVYRNYIVFRKQ